MPLLQSDLAEWDDGRFSSEEIEQAIRCAKRLLGTPVAPAGTYMNVHAAEDFAPCEIVTLDADGNAKRWSGTGMPIGITIGPLGKGNYGWIQTKQ